MPINPKITHEMQFTPGESVAFDVDAYNDAIVAHGPTFVHWQAIPNPIGLQQKYDARRPDDVKNKNVSNDFYYVKMGAINAFISGNSKEAKASNGGLVDSGRAQFTPTLYYRCLPNEEQKKVYLSPFDRFYLDDESILVPRGDLIEADITGVDKLPFPAVDVLHIVDANGVSYGKNDYDIVDGNIVWKGKRPGYNVEVGKGRVYSIKYLLRPYWYVERILHELRLVQTVDQLGNHHIIQANQSCIVAREYINHDQASQVAPESAETPQS